MKKILIFNIVALFALSSCVKVKDQEPVGPSRLVFKMKTDYGVNNINKTATREGETPTYWVELDGPESRNFELTATTVNVQPGIYDITVTSPAVYEMPAFGVPVYRGSTSVEVPEGGSATAGITCTQANTGVRFIFDESVKAFYDALTVKIEDNANAAKTLSYTYADETEAKTAYFDPGVLKLTLTNDGTPVMIGGQEYSLVTVAAKELWTITLKTASNNNGDIQIDIVVDTTTEDKEGNWGIGAVEGAGTFAEPYSVNDAINAMPVQNVWIEGYIVGTSTVTRSAPNAILLGSRSNAEPGKCMVMEISGSEQFAQFADPDVIGKKVKFQGDVAAKSTEFTSDAKAVLFNVVDFAGEVVNSGADNTDAITASGKVLKDISEESIFRMGATVKTDQLFSGAPAPEAYVNLIKRDFNSITLEYEMKMSLQYDLNNGLYDYRTQWLNKFKTFVLENQLDVHGHTLIWYKDIPEKWKQFSENPALLDQEEKDKIKADVANYIDITVKKYDYVRSWDVVNEAIDNSAGDYWPTLWIHVYGSGENYVREIFELTRAAVKKHNPGCKLFYNDYKTEMYPTKRRTIIELINKLNSEYAEAHDGEMLIDGIGLQMHLVAGISKTDLEEAVDAAVGTGCLIHISELSVSLAETEEKVPSTITQELLDKQDQTFMDMFDVAFNNVPKDKLWGITTWGVNDFYSVYKKRQGMLYDDNYNAKRSYFDIIKKYGE